MTIQNYCHVNGCRKNLSRKHFVCYPHLQLVPPEMLEPVERCVRLLNGPRPGVGDPVWADWVQAIKDYKAGKRAIINFVDNLLMQKMGEKK